MTCEKCGAVVGDVGTHDQWHALLDDVDSTLTDVEQKVDHVSNVLYQRGID